MPNVGPNIENSFQRVCGCYPGKVEVDVDPKPVNASDIESRFPCKTFEIVFHTMIVTFSEADTT